MKRYCVIAASIVLVLSFGCATNRRQSANPADTAVAQPMGDYRDRANWRRLQRGMNQRDVERLLGPAGMVVVIGDYTTWYYPDRVGGDVHFTHDRVDGWSEP